MPSAADPVRLVAAAGALALALAACTTTPLPLPNRQRVHPAGGVLGILAGARTGLVKYVFACHRQQDIALSDHPAGAFFWGKPPSKFVVLTSAAGQSRVFAVTVGGQTRSMSPPVTAPVRVAGHPVGDRLLLAGCEGSEPIVIVSLPPADLSTPPSPSPAAPKEVARGCPAALSPDGQSVAFSPDLVSVWRISSNGGDRPEEVVRLAGRKQLLSLGMRSPRILPSAGMSWSSSGLAVAMEGGGRFALVVVEPSGQVRVIPLGTARPTALAWDPGATLLAFTEHDRTGDALQTFDPVKHRLQLATLALGKELRGLVWSPRGDAMVTLVGLDHWLVVTPGGAKVRSIIVTPGAVPVDWTL